MKTPSDIIIDESVGAEFNADFLKEARDVALEVIQEAASQVTAGMKALEIKKIVQDLQIQKQAPRSWHPPQIRLGPNTLLGFGEVGLEDYQLQADDIFFIDIGPIYKGHEGDVGRTFSLGKNLEMQRCAEDVEKIWKAVRDHWHQNQINGQALYDFAQNYAQQMGNWNLSLYEANGHRISDFPHAAKKRGSIQDFLQKPSEDRWILEIQIKHPSLAFGAFFEDLLN